MSSPRESLLDLVPVVPVVVVDDLATAVPLARALVAGGLPVIELTLRTPVALDAIGAIADEVPEILVGAGTVVTPGHAKRALDAGAQFLVSPGTTPSLLAAMGDTGLPSSTWQPRVGRGFRGPAMSYHLRSGGHGLTASDWGIYLGGDLFSR